MKNMKNRSIISGVMIITLMAGLVLSACAKEQPGASDTGAASEAVPAEMPESEISANKGGFSAGASVHDPAIFEENGKYYIFGSHMESAASDDLRTWKSFSSGVNADNKLFSNLFDDKLEAFAFTGKNSDNGYSVWAPSVIYNKAMKKYVMYFCTSSTYKKSSLCYAVADKAEGPYEFRKVILDSGFDYKTVKDTDFFDYHDKAELKNYLGSDGYDNLKWPNCIDPDVFYDADGKMWIVYGSWSGGIFLLEIDEKTGLPVHPEEDAANEVDAYYGKHLIGGGHNSMEGPCIRYDSTNGYYYLFVSYGELQAKGGYQIRLFRSKKVDGPYEDTEGQTLGTVVDHSKYGLKMMGNYTFPSLAFTYMAPGGQTAFTDEDGKMYVVYHQRFKNGTEGHEPRVHQLFANADGWLVAAPFATSGETLYDKGYSTEAVTGTYYLVNHGTDISKKVHACEKITLTADGKITGDETGTYEITDGSPYVTINIGTVKYSGVMIRMDDEAGNDTMCFSAAGNNNETVWGVHYYESSSEKK